MVDYFADHFEAHEPVYFVIGPDAPNIKFQISLKYRILNDDGPLAMAVPALKGLHFGYTQTSLWDVESESRPFFDSSYRPSFMWSGSTVADGSFLNFTRLGLEVAVQHESNGKEGGQSRSLNYVYVEPSATFGKADNLHLAIGPRLIGYIGKLEDNPDIKDYRGHVDLRAVLGFGDGLAVSMLGRLGDDWDNGSMQLDFTYPLRKFVGGNFDVFLDLQYFNGMGESLREYNEHTQSVRLGVALVR